MKRPSGIPGHISDEMKHDLRVLFSISLALFLFVLFFQPFELDHFAFNNKLLFIVGLGGITFVIMTLFHIAIPYTWPRFFKTSEWENEPVYLISALIWVFTSVAFAYYLRYVGSIEISLYMMFKLAIICLVPVLILQIYYTNKSLRHQVKVLHETVIHLRATIPQDTENRAADTLELGSENWSERIILRTSDLIMIKSADNYIEIIYLENGQYRKKLIRNTLRNIEDLLGRYPDFIRCHRTSIVNILFIDKLISNYAGYKLQIRDSEEKVPVSRQYILKVKEALAKR